LEGVVLECALVIGGDGRLRARVQFHSVEPAAFEQLAAFISERIAGPAIGSFGTS
jgi:hypothetical protein